MWSIESSTKFQELAEGGGKVLEGLSFNKL